MYEDDTSSSLHPPTLPFNTREWTYGYFYPPQHSLASNSICNSQQPIIRVTGRREAETKEAGQFN